MHRRLFIPASALHLVGAWLAWLATVSAGRVWAQSEAAEPAAARPNIVLMLADDFGYECVRANGGTSYQTPHLDALAAGGARFEHCYAQPVCTPTRAQLMTGQSNVRNYVRFGYLSPDQRTFAHLLKDAGYATGIFGKWQLGNGFSGPAKFGFDDYTLWQLTRRPPRYANPGLEIAGKEIDFTHGEYGPDLVQKAALEFIDRNQVRPFLLYYPMMLTHGPFQPTPDSDDWDPTAIGEQVNNHERHFADMVAHLDGHVGELVKHLEERKLREKTLILFVGDNGTALKLTSEWSGRSVRGGKGATTDAGTRVPLIANWPSKIPAGTVVKDLIDTTDFLPTICEAAGVPLPGDLKLDGRSFLPQAQGRNGQPREWLYTWFAVTQQNQLREPVEFARTHRFKLYSDGRMFELDGQYGEVELDAKSLSAEAQSARELLSRALAQFAHARPPSLRASR